MINISDLSKKKKERKETRNKVYKMILEKCTKKIIDKSNSLSNEEYIYYDIPQVIFGFPLINKEECSLFLIKELVKNKFIVKYLGNGILFISWKDIQKKHKHINYHQKKNIVELDISKKARPLIKKINKDEYRNINDIPTSIKFLY